MYRLGSVKYQLDITENENQYLNLTNIENRVNPYLTET